MHKVVFPEARESSRFFPWLNNAMFVYCVGRIGGCFANITLFFVRVDSVFKQWATASLVVRLGRRGVAAGLLALP